MFNPADTKLAPCRVSLIKGDMTPPEPQPATWICPARLQSSLLCKRPALPGWDLRTCSLSLTDHARNARILLIFDKKQKTHNFQFSFLIHIHPVMNRISQAKILQPLWKKELIPHYFPWPEIDDGCFVEKWHLIRCQVWERNRWQTWFSPCPGTWLLQKELKSLILYLKPILKIY